MIFLAMACNIKKYWITCIQGDFVFVRTVFFIFSTTIRVFYLRVRFFLYRRVDKAGPGDNVGMNIKGLDKNNMPRSGDVMILKSDKTLKHTKAFTCQVQTQDIPGEIKLGYSPI